MVEFLLKERVAFFGEMGAAFRQVLHLGIIIDIEVLGLQHAPVELRVLDLVPPEIEKLCVRREDSGQEQEDEEQV